MNKLIYKPWRWNISSQFIDIQGFIRSRGDISADVPHRMTDTMGRMHSDAQFAGSSSVPAHVEMMGFLGIGNNPMVGCTVACAVDVATALSK